MTKPRYAALEARLGHRFADPALLEQALTHRSFGASNNERLEFLGDGVLGCAVADLLYAERAALPEGELTRRRAALVRKEALAETGERLGLRQLIRTDSNTPVTQSILADAVEAVLGAVFLDAGYTVARETVVRAFKPLLESGLAPKDAKTALQELLQSEGRPRPDYVVREEGPAHQRTFEAECTVSHRNLRTTGRGRSSKAAQQEAAQAMLEKLRG